MIDHAAHLLPAQGPITVFIHHNTLHAFEEQTFDEAVRRGAELFGCQPYLSEERYRDALERGRIRFTELRAVLEEDLGERAVGKVARLAVWVNLHFAMLQYHMRGGVGAELLWFVAETDALRRFRPETSAAIRGRMIGETRRWMLRDLRTFAEGVKRPGRPIPAWLPEVLERFGEASIEDWDQATWEAFTLRTLWEVCRAGVRQVPANPAVARPPIRHRDLLLAVTGFDADLRVNDVLTRLCAAFLDQGVSHWRMPGRERGLYHAFCALYRTHRGTPDMWTRGLGRELARLQDAGVSALACVGESLAALGVGAEEWEAYLTETLLALRGWAGMVRQVEVRGDRVAHPVPEGSLVEFLAVRLLLDRFSLADAARETLGFTGPLAELRAALRPRLPAEDQTSEPRAFMLFQLAQVLGWTPEELHHTSPADWAELIGEVESFSSVERRRVFHLAYERRFRSQALDAVALHRRHPLAGGPRFQVVCCLDEREESFRRHLEEIAPEVETFGVAGFFSVAMYYRGVGDAHFVPLCPVVVRPNHWVEERVGDGQEEEHQLRTRTRRALGAATHRFMLGTRGFALGALLATGLGVLASIPLVLRILLPRLYARFHGLLGQFVRHPRHTYLKLERSTPASGAENGHLGYTVAEMADAGERTLRDIGLVKTFARLVFLLGHGSNSLNNPHKSAYDCGACGGSPGGPNARAMARILNDRRVRERLAGRGLTIPDDTVFIGGFHNTCNDSVTLFDTDGLPASHRDELHAAQRDLKHACQRNAHERCRRFMSAPLTLSFADAWRHVEERAEDLAQTRPELGHATNALCVVGRRERTRGLYLDRRAFLTSYDPYSDDVQATILTRILQAVFPVCAGINLEYYFSHVDSMGWGCGSKLPHNITALLGVMDGAASDLRTGLPWQMVEIHEPVRLVIIIETTPDTLLRIFERNEGLGRLVRNGWVQVATLDPDSQAVWLWQEGGFHHYQPHALALPAAPSSTDWYRGWRDHLEFAEIVP